MEALLARLLAAALACAALGNGGAACETTGAAADAGPAPETAEAEPAHEPAEASTPTQPAEAGKPDGLDESDGPGTPETNAEPACLLDVFRRLHEGDWVRTRWTNKEEHTLLVTSRTDEVITIEEIVEDRALRKAWTQLDVNLEDGRLLALRERLADGTVLEREPEAESQRGTSDLLREPFRPDGEDEIEARIEVHAPDVAEPQTLRRAFLCRRYKITVEEGRYAHVWYSGQVPNYPIKIHYYERDLTIALKAFGTGRESAFTKPPPPRRPRTPRGE